MQVMMCGALFAAARTSIMLRIAVARPGTGAFLLAGAGTSAFEWCCLPFLPLFSEALLSEILNVKTR